MALDELYVKLDYIQSQVFISGAGGDRGTTIPAKLNYLRSDARAIPQLAYRRLQLTNDELFGGGALAGWGTGEPNRLTSSGTVLTVPEGSVWLVKERLKIDVNIGSNPLGEGTYYIYLKWNGNTATIEEKTTAERPTDAPSICIAKVVSNGSTLTIDQEDAEVDRVTLNPTIRVLRTPEAIGWPATVGETVTVAVSDTGIAIPDRLDGYRIVGVRASVLVAGSGNGSTKIQVIRNREGFDDNVLSTEISLESAYTANNGVINTDYDDLKAGDILTYKVTEVQENGPRGLAVTIEVTPY